MLRLHNARSSSLQQHSNHSDVITSSRLILMTYPLAFRNLNDDVFENIATVDVTDDLPVLVVSEDDVGFAENKNSYSLTKSPLW